jgi:hypothetical protein
MLADYSIRRKKDRFLVLFKANGRTFEKQTSLGGLLALGPNLAASFFRDEIISYYYAEGPGKKLHGKPRDPEAERAYVARMLADLAAAIRAIPTHGTTHGN